MNGIVTFGLSFASVCTASQPHAPSEGEWPALRAAVNRVFRPHGGDLTAELPLLFCDENRQNLTIITDASSGAGHDAASPGAPPAARSPLGDSPSQLAAATTGHHDRADLVADAIWAHAGFVPREASVMQRRVRVACVGAVFTSSVRRRHGWGTRVLAHALAKARQDRDLMLASGDGGLYRREAMSPLPPLASVRLPPPDSSWGDIEPISLSARSGTSSELAEVAALYAREPVHFIRSAEDWRRLLGARRLVDAPAEFTLLSRRGHIVAYVVAQAAGHRSDGSLRPRRILELAGDRGAILRVASHLANELLVPLYDHPTLDACADRGWQASARQFPITVQSLTDETTIVPWYGLNYV